MHLFGRTSSVVLLSAFCLVSASLGDRNWHYKGCLSTCDTERCASGSFEATKPLSLWLTGWTCMDDCKYDCMHKMTGNNIAWGQKIHQYYGKWPFWRFAGMQEPASVIFSMLNFVAHAVGLRKVRKRIPASHPMRPFYIGWAYFSMNAWLWSSVFHTRDLPITEKLDYFSAALVILNALYGTVVRVFQLYPHRERSKITSLHTSTPAWKLLGGACILIYAAHIYYLTSGPRFDYTYNTIFNLVLGLSHNILWTLYALPSSMSVLKSRFPNSPKNYRPSFVNKAGLFVLLTTLATTLELFDFPPWGRMIDAHALWHAATAPLGYLWYDFLIQDSSDPSWNAPLLRQRPE